MSSVHDHHGALAVRHQRSVMRADDLGKLVGVGCADHREFDGMAPLLDEELG
jgi:hypothetical protein